ncbi:glycerate kinase [Serratia ureilytica]
MKAHAPDSFSAKRAQRASGGRRRHRAFRQPEPAAHLREAPMADGGEGTVESMVAATGGEIVQVTVTGLLESGAGFYACWATAKPR